MAVLRPDQMMKCVVPVVMAGIIGVRIPLYPYLAPLIHSSIVIDARIPPDLWTRRLGDDRW